MPRARRPSRFSVRRGFTLVELLVALSIFVVLTIMTIGAINLSVTSERVRGAARQVQARLEGARDRAIFNSRTNPEGPRPVGVRLLVDENNPTICTSMVYIESAGVESGVVVVQENGVLAGVNTSWRSLYDRGLIGPGSIIKVGRAGGVGEVELAIHPATFPVTTERLLTVQGHPDRPEQGTSLPLRYSIELGADVMADEDPLALPSGTCIDLESSFLANGLPDGWVNLTANGPQFSNRMDIMFSARGTIVGNAAGKGLIHLYLVTIEDALENAAPGNPFLPRDINGDGTDEYPSSEFPEPPERHGEELGITIFTKAGRTISHAINPIIPNETPDPWRFGRQGEVSR